MSTHTFLELNLVAKPCCKTSLYPNVFLDELAPSALVMFWFVSFRSRVSCILGVFDLLGLMFGFSIRYLWFGSDVFLLVMPVRFSLVPVMPMYIIGDLIEIIMCGF